MKNFQQRFLFYLHRCEELMNREDTTFSELQAYKEEDFNAAAGILLEMCYTNYILTTGDAECVEGFDEWQKIFEDKRKEYADEITAVIKKVIYTDFY